jgi:hypothetical protein
LNFHGSKIVKAAVRKYNISQFAVIILELFPEVVTKENNKNLLDLEDFYIKSLLPNYKILTEVPVAVALVVRALALLVLSTVSTLSSTLAVPLV